MAEAAFTIGLVLTIIGALVIALEVAHPGVFLLIPGSIFLVAGLLFMFFPAFVTTTYYGAAVLVLVAAVATLGTIPLYRRIAPIHKPMVTIPASITGESGLVVAPVVPDSLSGKVRVRSEVWSARAKMPIPAGTRVRVIGGEGVSVWVEPESGSADAAAAG